NVLDGLGVHVIRSVLEHDGGAGGCRNTGGPAATRRPLLLELEDLGEAYGVQRDVSIAAQEIGNSRVGIGDKRELDVLDFRAAEDVTIERDRVDVRADLPVAELVRTRAHELVRPVRAGLESIQALLVGVFQEAPGRRYQ